MDQFKAPKIEADRIKRALQAALDAVDLASAESFRTAVCSDLKTARKSICEAITFLTGNDPGPLAMARDTDPDEREDRSFCFGDHSNPYARPGWSRSRTPRSE